MDRGSEWEVDNHRTIRLQVKKSTYARTGTPKVMAKAPGGPRNSYEVVLGLREALSEWDMMAVYELWIEVR